MSFEHSNPSLEATGLCPDDTQDILKHAAATVSLQLEFASEHKTEISELADGLTAFTEVMDAVDWLPSKEQGAMGWWFKPIMPTPATKLTRALWIEVAKPDWIAGGPKQTERQLRAALLFNHFILPMSGVQTESDRSVTAKQGFDREEDCAKAEIFFVDAAARVIGGEAESQRRLAVFHDNDGRPLAFEKDTDAETAILLRQSRIGKMVVPIGSIVVVGENMRNEISGKVRTSYGATVTTYGVADTFEISPQRLSAWTYENPLDVGMFALRGYGINNAELLTDRYDRLRSRNIDSFTTAANQVVSQIL